MSTSRFSQTKTFCVAGILFLSCLLSPDPSEITTKQMQLFKESQKVRKRYSLPKQVLDKELCEQAQDWARYMANTNQFRHGGGEQIIARGYNSPLKAIQAWMNSSGHRKWILCRKPRVGFGFATSKNGHPYYVGVYRD